MNGFRPANPVVCGLRGAKVKDGADVAPVVSDGWLETVDVEVVCAVMEGLPSASPLALLPFRDHPLLKLKLLATPAILEASGLGADDDCVCKPNGFGA